jgi:hypothetical protein
MKKILDDAYVLELLGGLDILQISMWHICIRTMIVLRMKMC